jgi:zinc transport system substrate-binding protein
VNYPLKYFAERIGGDHVRVEFPAPADVDPAYWNPALAGISAFQKADLILLNGAGYAKWIAKVSLPRSKIVDKLKTLGVDSLVFDPCSNSPDQGDFMTVMQRNVEDFRRAFAMAD